jgi:hypothetical protein
MHNFINVCSLFILSISSFAQSPYKKPFAITASVSHTLLIEGIKCWNIEMELKNQSAQTQNFIIDKCAEDRCMITDTVLYQIKNRDCALDQSAIVRMAPGETKKYSVNIYCQQPVEQYPKCRVGMLFFFAEDNLYNGPETKPRKVSTFAMSQKLDLN